MLEGWNWVNASGDLIEEEVLRDPWMMFFKMCVADPALEESLFRGIPSFAASGIAMSGGMALAKARRTMAWRMGVGSSAAFALSHNFNGSEFVAGFPILQFAAGLWLWAIARKTNTFYAMGAHSALNMVVLGSILRG